MAFDENYRSHAPGVHLLHEITKAQADRADIDMTDSCAIASHPMMDRFWPDRFGVCDLAIQLRRDREGAFVDACDRVKLRKRLRDFAKSAAKRLLGRKES